jgi:uncharacterized protein
VLTGAVHLPTIGRLVLGPEPGCRQADDGADTALVSVISNAVLIQAGDSCWTFSLARLLAGQGSAVPATGNSRPGEWQPVRTLRVPGWNLALEDTDPYRGSTAPRLTDAEVAGWQRDFQLAWQQIEDDYAAFAPGLAAGLTTLTPLAPDPDRLSVSATARHAFGAVATSPPADPDALARILIQEFQRAKLGAVLDLFDLYDHSDDRLFQMPWGEEKVQFAGLLLDAYTHLAQAEGGRRAEWRAQTGEAIDLLLGSGALTPLGERFVRRMHHSAASWPGGVSGQG